MYHGHLNLTEICFKVDYEHCLVPLLYLLWDTKSETIMSSEAPDIASNATNGTSTEPESKKARKARRSKTLKRMLELSKSQRTYVTRTVIFSIQYCRN